VEHTPTLDYNSLQQQLARATAPPDVYSAIVDTPFNFKVDMARLHLGIIVLLLLNKATGMIDRVALSNTELAKGTTDISVKRFEDIKIPADHHENFIAKAIRTQRPQLTTDWYYLFTPALNAEESRFNQAGGGIACSAIYPLIEGVQGALIFSYFQYPEKLGSYQRQFMKTYTAIVSRRLQAGL
jgi:hypothetical protein